MIDTIEHSFEFTFLRTFIHYDIGEHSFVEGVTLRIVVNLRSMLLAPCDYSPSNMVRLVLIRQCFD